MQNRATVRPGGKKVIHRHRVAGTVIRRVSELVYIRGRPRAILGWIDLGGVRTPLYISELDPAKLAPTAAPDTFRYADVTVDPRFVDAAPANAGSPP